MGFWDKFYSAAKSAVNKAAAALAAAARAAKKAAARAVNKAAAALAAAARAAYEAAKRAMEKAKEKSERARRKTKRDAEKEINDDIIIAEDKISDAKDYIKKDAEKEVEKSGENIIDLTAQKEAADAAAREAELKIEEAKKPTWMETFMGTVGKATKSKLGFLGILKLPDIAGLWERVTGRKLTGENAIEVAGHIADWILPVNAISKLLTGKNIDGEPAEFGGGSDWFDLSTGLLMLVPLGKVGTVVGKVGAKGFIKMIGTKFDEAVRIFKLLNVDDQAKLLRGLSKTDDGVKVINRLLSKKALDKTLVNPTLSIVNRHIRDKILIGSGFSKLLTKVAKPKTIMWGLTGILGAIGSAYGVAFGTEWFAKEGLWELYAFPISDKMRDYRYEPTAEKAAGIQRGIDKLEMAMPKAQSLVKSVSWLWPFTKDEWDEWADGIEFELNQIKEEFGSIVVPELIELPEEVEAPVRDIIDGDTIDVSLDGFVDGNAFKLPQYERTGHARIRIVGINSPEKSPKGEIACTGIEIFKVEGTWADEARNRLLPLNDKNVVLRIDPNNRMDTFGRILAVVERSGEDIGLRQIKEGLACYYFRQAHKYVDDALYDDATTKAKRDGEGMWKGLEDIESEEDKIKIVIKTSPSNAKLFLDDVALHHNSPSDEDELSDVIHLFTPGKHILSAEKGGISAMKEIEIVKGDNGEIELILETAPIVAEAEEIVEEEIVEEETQEETPAVPTIEYTESQRWAMKEAFEKIWGLIEGKKVMSKIEREVLIEGFGLYTDEQKMALLPLWTDLEVLTMGSKTLSKDEFLDLLSKHQIEMEI